MSCFGLPENEAEFLVKNELMERRAGIGGPPFDGSSNNALVDFEATIRRSSVLLKK